MTSYAVVLTFPGEIKKEITKLQEQYKKYITYRIEPHITLKYPFATEVDMAVINKKLRKVADRSAPFSLVLNGIEYFEGENNVAYIAVQTKEPIINLHNSIVHSLEDLDKEESMEIFDLQRFSPHVTIGEKIPQEVFPYIKKTLARLNLIYEIEVSSFTLFTAGKDGIWKSSRVFKF